ncbi:MAG: hypothetical protein H6673_15635 [Anaerolineales bacterium]|nr:hypothetical protein [Anaerolineales bacterium]
MIALDYEQRRMFINKIKPRVYLCIPVLIFCETALLILGPNTPIWLVATALLGFGLCIYVNQKMFDVVDEYEILLRQVFYRSVLYFLAALSQLWLLITTIWNTIWEYPPHFLQNIVLGSLLVFATVILFFTQMFYPKKMRQYALDVDRGEYSPKKQREVLLNELREFLGYGETQNLDNITPIEIDVFKRYLEQNPSKSKYDPLSRYVLIVASIFSFLLGSINNFNSLWDFIEKLSSLK